jgi:hypothetical protein
MPAGTEIAAPAHGLTPVEELQLAVDSEHPAFLERTRLMFAHLRRLADSTPAGILESLRLDAGKAQSLQAHVRLEMTSKGNLSVEWYPHDQALQMQMQVSASMGYYRPDRLQLLRDARELFDSPYYMARRCKTPLQVRQGRRLWCLLLQYFVEAVEGYIGKLGSVIDVVRAGPTLSIVEDGCNLPHLQLNYPVAATE